MPSKKTLVAFALLAAAFACQSTTGPTAPSDLVGVWKTSDPKYAGRFFEIKRDVVIFGTGEGNADIHTIFKIEKVREAAGILYTIFYVNRDGRQDGFSFYYDPANRGVIRLKHQRTIAWMKERR